MKTNLNWILVILVGGGALIASGCWSGHKHGDHDGHEHHAAGDHSGHDHDGHDHDGPGHEAHSGEYAEHAEAISEQRQATSRPKAHEGEHEHGAHAISEQRQAASRPTAKLTPPVPRPQHPQEKHLRNVRQLTFGGENAEAYLSRDVSGLSSSRLVPHSTAIRSSL